MRRPEKVCIVFADGPANPPIHARAAADRALFAKEILKSRPKILV
jgi:hypothetical protein